MKFQLTKDIPNGTHLQGYVTTTYDRLVEVFGKPNGGASDKTTCEWWIRFEDGTCATIYDWKEEYTPKGKYAWHVGGHSRAAEVAVWTEVTRPR